MNKSPIKKVLLLADGLSEGQYSSIQNCFKKMGISVLWANNRHLAMDRNNLKEVDAIVTTLDHSWILEACKELNGQLPTLAIQGPDWRCVATGDEEYCDAWLSYHDLEHVFHKALGKVWERKGLPLAA